MRAVVASVGALSLAIACSTASIGEYPDTELAPPAASGDTSSGTPSDGGTGQTFRLTVTITGTGSGRVTSTPSGVTCQDKTCSGTFAAGTTVGLVPAPDVGSSFVEWGGACAGNGVCTPVVDRDVAVSATMTGGGALPPGTYTGAYTNNRPSNGCTFNNAGNITLVVTSEADGGVSNTSTVTGLQLRSGPPGCNLLSTTSGTSPKEPVNVNGTTLTGTWTVDVPAVGAQLPLPYTGTLIGNQFAGSWTCPSCTGNFALTRQ